MVSRLSRFSLAACIALSAPLVAFHPPAHAWEQSSERASYILFADGSNSTTMSGSTADLRHARALRRGNEPLLYARWDGAAYLIRDPATLRQAEAIFEPQRRLGARQGALGARQGALGARQAALGAEQGRLGARQAGATPRQASALARQQSELSRRQSELGRQQSALGAEQAELGREQSRLARVADAQLRRLLMAAISSGVAQRVD